MRRTLRWSRPAERDLERIERNAPALARRIRQAARLYADQGYGDVLKLTGQTDTYRLRVGDWRVLFTLTDAGLVILALRVLNRRDAYR